MTITEWILAVLGLIGTASGLVFVRETIELAKENETLKKRIMDFWIPVRERLPEEKISGAALGFDFEEVLCTTVWGDVRAYKFGTPIGHDKPHFWLSGEIMDEYVIAWQYKPEPYEKGGSKT